MLHASNKEVPRTIGPGRGGLTDRILHGSDSRYIPDTNHARPPTLQDVVMMSLMHHLVRVTLVDMNEMIGRITWYNAGKIFFKLLETDALEVIRCERVFSLSPIEVDEEAIPFLTESLRASLLASEERTSRLQIVRRRIRQRNIRIAAANKYARRT